MIEIQEKLDIGPKCGHCKIDLELVWYQELRGAFGRRYIYYCPNCQAVLL